MTHPQTPVTGVVFSTDPAVPVSANRIDGSAEGIDSLVDGLTEAVMLGETGPVLFVNAHGPNKGLPPNPRGNSIRGPLPARVRELEHHPRNGRRYRPSPRDRRPHQPRAI